MQIHPYAWLITVPLTIAMIQIALSPAENAIRRSWLMLREFEAEAWFRLGRGYEEPQLSATFKACYAATTAVFATLSVLSFCVFIEAIPGTM